MAEIRHQKHIDAAARYRDLYLLPRFVEEDHEDGVRRRRRLDEGEFHPKSKRYSMLSNIEHMSDFGVGIGLYFKLTAWVGLIIFFSAIFQLPSAHYFASKAYDPNNSRDATWKVGASASCQSQRRVCLNEDCTEYAGESHYPSRRIPRYQPNYGKVVFAANAEKTGARWRNDLPPYWDDDFGTPSIHELGVKIGRAPSNEKLTVGLRSCPLKRWQGINDFAMMVFMCVALYWYGRAQGFEAEQLDYIDHGAKEFSVMVENPDPDYIDPAYWKAWFEQRFGAVFMLTVCLNNGELLLLLKRKRELEQEMLFEAAFDATKYEEYRALAANADPEFEAHLIDTNKAKPLLGRLLEVTGLDTSMDSFVLELIQVNKKISALKDRTYRACKIFCIFNSADSQVRCLETLSIAAIPRALGITSSIGPDNLFNGSILHVKEAPDEASIVYEFLEVSQLQHTVDNLLTWFVVTGMLVATYFAVSASFNIGLPALGAFLISFFNAILPVANQYLVRKFEHHRTISDLENSFLAKTVTCRAFTSAIILYLVGRAQSAEFLSPYYIGAVQSVLLADAITSPVLRALDPVGFIKRHVASQFARTPERVKQLYATTDYFLADRYTDLAKSLFMSSFFSALLPLGYYYTVFSCFVNFWVDKYCMIYVFSRKPQTNEKLARIALAFCAMNLLAHSVVTAHFYHGWPFSSLCKSQTESLTEDGVATANKIGAITSDVYYYCLSISSDFLPPVTVQPWYQGTVQQKLVVFYRTVAMIIFAYIVFLYILAPALDFCYHLFFHDYRPANMINETLIEKYDSIDGYIPQVRVAGMAHKTVVACSAPISNLDGGLECAPYLLEWVASKERAGVDAEEEIQAEFSPEEKDTIYRAQNLYFDDQLADVVDNKRALLGRAVQYIFNEETIARANNNKHKSRLRLKDVARAVQSLRRGLSLDRRLQHPGTSLDGPGL